MAVEQEPMGNLVISRKLNESVKIGSDVIVTVVDIDRGKIRLRITAPKSIPIYRTELIDQGKVAGDPSNKQG